jgi:mRNA-degrading endonuclease YafQ of YafQ-DinJ toxin-antitoxin module
LRQRSQTAGEIGRHRNHNVSTHGLKQIQHAPCQTQYQDHPHPGEEKRAKTCKNKLDLIVAGIYCVPCECSIVFVGQTGRLIETRCKEHTRYIRLDQPGRSAVVEHRFGTGYIGLMIKEAIEIKLHPSSFDRDCGFTLIRSWHLMTDMLKQYRCTNLEAST